MKDLKEVLPHYLPYGVEVKYRGKTYPLSVFRFSDIKEEFIFIWNTIKYIKPNQVKPILYPLEALTDDLPGIGVPLKKIATKLGFEKELVRTFFYGFQCNGNNVKINFDEFTVGQFSFPYNDSRRHSLPFKPIFDFCLKHHFNIFGLSEEQFIDKRKVT